MDGSPEDYEVKHILLIPNEFIIGMQTISVSCKGKSKWLDFSVSEAELKEFINSLF